MVYWELTGHNRLFFMQTNEIALRKEYDSDFDHPRFRVEDTTRPYGDKGPKTPEELDHPFELGVEGIYVTEPRPSQESYRPDIYARLANDLGQLQFCEATGNKPFWIEARGAVVLAKPDSVLSHLHILYQPPQEVREQDATPLASNPVSVTVPEVG